MTEDFLEESDGDRKAVEEMKSRLKNLVLVAKDTSARQAPFFDLIELHHKLFWELPNLTTRDVDARLQVMFDKLMDASAVVGISRNSVPSLKECCGKKRVWPEDLWKSQTMDIVVDPFTGTSSPGLGDVLKKILEFFGFRKPCAGCERRRRWLNNIRWPWTKS